RSRRATMDGRRRDASRPWWGDGCGGAEWRWTTRSRRTTRRASGSSASSPSRRLQVVRLQIVDRLELGHLQLPRERGKLEVRDLADRLAEQCAANGRRHRDVPLLEVHGVAEDEVVGLLQSGLLVAHVDGRAEPDLVVRDLGDVDGRQLAQALPELAEAGLHELLTLERSLVLAVLAQVAHLDRFPDLVGERDVELELELLDLVPKLLLQLFDHGAPDFVTTIKGDARPGAGRRISAFYPAGGDRAIPGPRA